MALCRNAPGSDRGDKGLPHGGADFSGALSVRLCSDKVGDPLSLPKDNLRCDRRQQPHKHKTVPCKCHVGGMWEPPKDE